MQGWEKKIEKNHAIAQVHFIHTRDSLHSFLQHPPLLNKLSLKELPTFCAGVPEPLLSSFMPNASFSHSLLSVPFFTHGYGLDSLPHSVLPISPLPGEGLNASSFMPPVHTSCSSSPSFLLLYFLSHKAQLCPCYLPNSIPVNIFPSFLPLTGKTQDDASFSFPDEVWGVCWGFLVWLFLVVVGGVFLKEVFKKRI